MRVEIRRLVKRLGITTIYVTHDQKEALSMADRCAILRQGRVEQVGSPRDLYERPANRFVADFIGGANLVPGKVRVGEWTARDLRGIFNPGEAVTLAIRPEALRLHAAPGAELNRFAGCLTETIYLGESTESWLRMSDGFILKALETGPTKPAPPAADIPFHVNPADVTVLAAE
jgi:ABC-type Fe3+/spermidine/putrescine transport system ATPase subunit